MGKYYMTKKSVDEYIKAAEGHNGSEIISLLREHLHENSHVLEIGSGPGTDWSILNKYYQVTGSDYSTEFLKRLKASFPGGEFLLLDASTLRIDKSFDAIYSNKVLHHLQDEELEMSIRRQHEILNPGGVICHSFWKGEASEIYKDLFVNYHTDAGLLSLFEDLFSVLLMEYYKEFDEGDSILFIGQKKDRTI